MLERWLYSINEIKLVFVVHITIVYGDLWRLADRVEGLEVGHVVRDVAEQFCHRNVDPLRRLYLAFDTLFQLFNVDRHGVLFFLELVPFFRVLLVTLRDLLHFVLELFELFFVAADEIELVHSSHILVVLGGQIPRAILFFLYLFCRV